MNIVEYLKTAEFSRSNEGNMDVRTYAMMMGVSQAEAINVRAEFMRQATMSIASSEDEVLEHLNNKYRVYDDFMITFGQLFVLESTMYRHSASMPEKALTLCQVLLRPKDEEVYDNSDAAKEVAHKNMLLEEEGWLMSVFAERMFEKRKDFHEKRYEGVFYRPQKEVEEERESLGDEYEPEDPSTFSGRDAYEYNYYWLNILDDLAKNNPLNYAPIMDLDVRTAAAWCARERTRIKVENNEAKEQELLRKANQR